MRSPLPNPTDGETIAELVDRLGPPPDEVVQSWINEARQRGVTLTPELDSRCWEHIRIDSSGELTLPSIEIVPSPRRGEQPKNTEKIDASASRRAIWVGVTAAGLLIAGGIFWWARRSADAPVRQSSNAQKSKSPDPFSTTASDPHWRAPQSSTPSAPNEQTRTTKSPSRAPSASFMLDAMLPPEVAVSTTVHTDVSTNETISPVVAPELVDDPATIDASIDSADLSSDADDEPIADAEEQNAETLPIQIPERMFLSLPPVVPSNQENHPASIAWPDGQVPRLSFPFASDLRLRSGATEQDWEIVDAKNDVAIARLNIAGGELSLGWTPAATDSVAAKSLLHGRVDCDAGMIWLRPMLSSDPVPIDFESRDVKRMWPLGGVIPPGVTRCNIDIEIPETIDIGWIEPIDPSALRKTRGIAVLNLKDSEIAAAVVRIDLQTNNNLSMRIRTAARISPEMPWQWTDRSGVEQTIASVASRIEMFETQLSAMTTAIDQAKRMGDRRTEATLKLQRESIAKAIEQWRSLDGRLAELNQLLATLAEGARMTVSLSVDWSDKRQMLLQPNVARGWSRKTAQDQSHVSTNVLTTHDDPTKFDLPCSIFIIGYSSAKPPAVTLRSRASSIRQRPPTG